jgi:hypothetical protein
MSASSVTDIPARCLVLLLFAVLVALPTSSYGLLRGHYSFYADVEVRRRGTATMSAKIWFDYENSRERFELDLWGSGFVTEIFRYNTVCDYSSEICVFFFFVAIYSLTNRFLVLS